MKKAKKLGLQSLALVLMAFVLVAGVAFGMTGAWFQGADNGSMNEIELGNQVSMHVTQGGHNVTTNALTSNVIAATRNTRTKGSDSGDYAMPGDTYTIDGDVYITTGSAHAKMYLFLRVTSDVNDAFTVQSGFFKDITTISGATEITGNDLTAIGAYTGVRAFTVEAGEEFYAQILDSTKTITLSGENLDNTYAGQTLNFKIEVAAVQNANLTGAEAWDLVESEFYVTI